MQGGAGSSQCGPCRSRHGVGRMVWAPVLSSFEYHFKQKDRIKLRVRETGESWDQALRELQREWAEHDALNSQLPAFAAPPPADPGAARSVAFMFLTTAPLNQEDLWVEWFGRAPPDRFDVVVHNDQGGDIGRLRELSRLVAPTTKTGWATSGLARATLLLLREALKRPSNTHFVLLSNSDIPLLSFDDFYADVTSRSLSRFSRFSLNWDESLGRDIWQPPNGRDWQGCTKRGCHAKADQWAMWTRADAVFFAENNFLKFLKPGVLFVDEPYFIQLMHEHEREYDNKCVTYTFWKFGTDSPVIFEDVDRATSSKARGDDCWFLRKVSRTATLSADFKRSIGLLVEDGAPP